MNSLNQVAPYLYLVDNLVADVVKPCLESKWRNKASSVVCFATNQSANPSDN